MLAFPCCASLSDFTSAVCIRAVGPHCYLPLRAMDYINAAAVCTERELTRLQSTTSMTESRRTSRPSCDAPCTPGLDKRLWPLSLGTSVTILAGDHPCRACILFDWDYPCNQNLTVRTTILFSPSSAGLSCAGARPCTLHGETTLFTDSTYPTTNLQTLYAKHNAAVGAARHF